ncbi:hypothetical protein pb186bvf_018942 [Paramecium bursaria]
MQIKQIQIFKNHSITYLNDISLIERNMRYMDKIQIIFINNISLQYFILIYFSSRYHIISIKYQINHKCMILDM